MMSGAFLHFLLALFVFILLCSLLLPVGAASWVSHGGHPVDLKVVGWPIYGTVQ